MSELKSIQAIQAMSMGDISRNDLLGLGVGSLLGLYATSQFSSSTMLKIISVVVGAELGIIIARTFGPSPSVQRNVSVSDFEEVIIDQ